MATNFEGINKALTSLKEALDTNITSDLERDGVIQRFEYTIELTWKLAKRVLNENGLTAIAPKEVIREMAKIGWIDNPKIWINFIKYKNLTSHTYNEKIAQEVYEKAKQFYPICTELVEILKEKSIND